MSTATVQPIRAVVTHWVDVRDHLPADDRLVLLHCPTPETGPQDCQNDGMRNEDLRVWPGWYDMNEDCWHWASGDLAEPVTHWAEMPEPPKP